MNTFKNDSSNNLKTKLQIPLDIINQARKCHVSFVCKVLSLK